MANRRDRSKCFLCGSDQQITDEHVPPKGIFAEPRPTNLITVPCCQTCNNSNSKADELFRLFVAGAVNRNHRGHELWNKKILPNTIEKKRLKYEIRSMIRTARSVSVATPSGTVELPYVFVPQAAIKPTLIRITKGLLWTFYPGTTYNDLKFEVQQINQFDLARQINVIAPILRCDERGEGAFRFWHAPVADAPRCAMWILEFFNSAAFAIFQMTNDRHSARHRKSQKPDRGSSRC